MSDDGRDGAVAAGDDADEGLATAGGDEPRPGALLDGAAGADQRRAGREPGPGDDGQAHLPPLRRGAGGAHLRPLPLPAEPERGEPGRGQRGAGGDARPGGLLLRGGPLPLPAGPGRRLRPRGARRRGDVPPGAPDPRAGGRSCRLEQMPIAEFLVGNLDERGFLECSVEEAARILEVSTDEVRAVLRELQAQEPVGIGARDLKECLLLQLDYLEARGTTAPHVRAIIERPPGAAGGAQVQPHRPGAAHPQRRGDRRRAVHQEAPQPLPRPGVPGSQRAPAPATSCRT